jgi:hypothetical protein
LLAGGVHRGDAILYQVYAEPGKMIRALAQMGSLLVYLLDQEIRDGHARVGRFRLVTDNTYLGIGVEPPYVLGSDDPRWSRTNDYVMHRALSIFFGKKRVGPEDPPLFGNLHKQPFVLEEEITNPVVVWSHR